MARQREKEKVKFNPSQSLFIKGRNFCPKEVPERGISPSKKTSPFLS
jgi:hypothetical protein